MSGDESNDDGNTDKENHNTAVCLASESETENEENEELFAQNLGASAGDVKSKAVVKYSSVRTPAKFCELQSNTDLNNPPSNWLRRQGAKFGVKGTWTIRNGPTEFSSLSIANTFPDSIGQVDVISDAENIKKLLKMPYNDSHMSMMVHRVHRTLLLDDFDIHRHLLRTSETEWKWLRRFFYEQHIGIDRPDNSRGSLQNRSMFSKFLYHSLADANVDDSLSPEPRHRSNSLPDRYHSVLSPETHCHPQAHISRTRESSNKDSKKSEFLRNVLWTFEDINMLIGTDMPIFGGGTRPAVSLRLRDMGKPINVLTGMDYWLDNLMCNVPELAMCYHIDGIVQYYELMKTEDIPNLKESKFSPIVVKDIAQNILSFLKSNAAKEGHTYWLFKGSNDDIVKLYDLTTLCGADTDAQRREGQRAEEEEEEQVEEENPFTVPVAMLLYRVARNMAAAPDGRRHTSDICKLLRNCIRLLQSDGRHADKSEIIASANYMLSDFLLPAEGYLNNKQKESGTGSAGEEPSIVVYKDISDEDSNYHLRADISVTVKALCMPDQPTFADQESERPQYMYESLEDRCLAALKYIAQGLTYVEKSSWSRQDTVNPHFPIPLPYESLASPRTNSPVPESSLESRVATSDPIQERVAVRSPLSDGPPPNSWQYQLKVLLLHKATVAWHTLAESASSLNKFGRALKYIKLALTCLEVARALCSAVADKSSDLLSMILMLSGDVHVMLAHHVCNLAAYREEYTFLSDVDGLIIDIAAKDIPHSAFRWAYGFESNLERNILVSIECYQVALSGLRSKTEEGNIYKRLGNSSNELGVFYMNTAMSMINDAANEPVLRCLEELWKKSGARLSCGIEAFDKIGDSVNVGLVNANLGRLMRLCAQSHAELQGGGREFTPQERHCYLKAASYYLTAREKLQSREACTDIWDSISWELSSTYFNMATQLQDYAPLSSHSREEVEKEVTDCMTKALKYCDLDTQTAQLPVRQYRGATIQHRLASLYHNAFRGQTSEQRRKHLRTLAELHYGRAVTLFQQLEQPCELVRIQLERIALCEFTPAGQSVSVKCLQAALVLMLEAEPWIALMQERMADESAASGDTSATMSSKKESNVTSMNENQFMQEASKLLGIMQQQLQGTLMALVKAASTPAKRGKGPPDAELLKTYKSMYQCALRMEDKTELIITNLLQTLRQLNRLHVGTQSKARS